MSVEHGLLTEVAGTELSPGVRLTVLRDDTGRHFAAPTVDDGRRRAEPGDGAAEAAVRCVVDGTALESGFAVTSWDGQLCTGESGVAVDQTNESVIVGDAAVVKWSVEVPPGPHPAPHRLGTLVSAGYTGMPRPWGVISWRPAPSEPPRLVATVVEYVPGAVDGWDWAVADVRTALATGSDAGVRDSARRLGALVGALHSALAIPGRARLTRDEATEFAAEAHAELDAAAAMTGGPEGERLRGRVDELHARLNGLGGAAGTPIIDVHGDLHVGQILRADDRYVVTDFDGNPVLEPAERLRRQPAATDVAGMLQSLDNVGHVVVGRTEGADAAAVARLTSDARTTFLESYRGALAVRHETSLLEDSLLTPLRIRQICREYLYAAKHLRRWLYVPDAALAALED